MTDSNRLHRAEAQVDAMIGFYIHLAAYVVFTGIMIALNARSGGGWWAQWPALGWGLGVLGHGLAVFGRLPRAVAQWRLRKIHRLQADPSRMADRRN